MMSLPVFHQLDIIPLDVADRLLYDSSTLENYPKIEDTVMGDKDSEIGIVFQHGFIGSNIDFLYIANHFASSNFRVVLPLLPGHGVNADSIHPTCYLDWIEKHAKSIEFLRHEREDRKIFLVGHSLGGCLSLIQAARRDDIAGVITIAGVVKYFSFLHFLAKILGKTMGERKVKYRKFKFHDKRLFSNPYIKRIETNFHRITLKTLMEAINLIEEADKALPQIKQPILVIHSKKDRTVPFFNAKRILKRVKSASKRLVSLDQSHHIVVADTDKDRVIYEINTFISLLEQNNLGSLQAGSSMDQSQ